ncbi:MAG: PPC domain-containing protein [bacterium]|nr:PPC domain-containing protein [bacterium]
MVAPPPGPESPPPTTEDLAPEPLALHVDGDTVWQDIFDTLTAPEQACIHGELDDDLLQSVLQRQVLSQTGSEPWEASIFSCLDPDTAGSLFLAALMVGFREDLGVGDLSGEEMACLRDWVAGIDVAALVAADVAGEDDAVFVEPMLGAVGCVAVRFLTATFADSGVDMADLSEDEMSCLQQWQSDLAEADLAALASGGDGFAALGLFGFSPLSCIPDRFLAAMLGEMGMDTANLSEDQVSCLRQWLSDLGTVAATDPDDALAAFGEMAYGLSDCLPELGLPDLGLQPSGPDDHADSAEGATKVAVDGSVDGALDHFGDVDVFVFEAVEGERYRVGVALGSLEDSVVSLYDADGWELAFNDDHWDSLASQITWAAPESGSYHIEVGSFDGFGTGSYTLSIGLTGPDDHGDWAEGATAVTVGQPVEGSVDHLGDVDFFTFEAVAGERYRIEVTLGSLGDSLVSLYDADGWELAFNDDHGDSLASLITWVAPESGSYYVAVEAVGLAVAPPDDPATESGSDDLEAGGLGDPGAGSYTLSVTGR